MHNTPSNSAEIDQTPSLPPMKSKNMHGFLCRSDSSISAACVPSSTRSVVVPRRPDRTLVDHAVLSGFNSYTAYTRLLESRRRTLATHEKKKVVPVPSASLSSTTPIPLPLPMLGSGGKEMQVVVMRVSIHCQGCAGKIKKHIAKMEGVKSFIIDLEAKRVTVTGNISPVGVLESISKVKKAEFWHI